MPGLKAVLKTVDVRGTKLHEVRIYDGEEAVMYAGNAETTPARAQESALAAIKKRILGAEVELRTVAKRIDEYKAMLASIAEIPICYGALTSDNQPDCDGPDVKRVRVFGYPDSPVPFVTDYCSECCATARSQGATIEFL